MLKTHAKDQVLLPGHQQDVAPGSPLAIVALFVEIIKERFRPGNDLSWVWHPNATPEASETNEPDAPTKLYIAPAFGVENSARNIRPAVLVNKGPTMPQKVSINNQFGQQINTGKKAFMVHATIPINIEVVSDKEGESALLADLVWYYLLAAREMIQSEFGLHEIGEPVLGETRPYAEAKNHFSTRINFNVTNAFRWMTTPISKPIREVAVRLRTAGVDSLDQLVLESQVGLVTIDPAIPSSSLLPQRVTNLETDVGSITNRVTLAEGVLAGLAGREATTLSQLVDASQTATGFVNTQAQGFGGVKTFFDGVRFGDGTLQTTASYAPDLSGFATLTSIQTLTNKTLAAPVLSGHMLPTAAGGSDIGSATTPFGAGFLKSSASSQALVIDGDNLMHQQAIRIKNQGQGNTGIVMEYSTGAANYWMGNVTATGPYSHNITHKGLHFHANNLGMDVVNPSFYRFSAAAVPTKPIFNIEGCTGQTAPLQQWFKQYGDATPSALIAPDGALTIAGVPSNSTAINLPFGTRITWGGTQGMTCGASMFSIYSAHLVPGHTNGLQLGMAHLMWSRVHAQRYGDSQNFIRMDVDSTTTIIAGRPVNGTTAVANVLNSLTALNVAGSKILSVQNNTVEKAFFAHDGTLETDGAIILKSPDGTRYRITVANGGTLTTSPA